VSGAVEGRLSAAFGELRDAIGQLAWAVRTANESIVRTNTSLGIETALV
jgi:hypothetical protein